MSEIKGPKGIGPAQGVTGPSAARRAQQADEAAAVSAPDPMVQLFDQIADQMASGAIGDRAAGVRAAVDAVLAQEFATLPAEVRDALAADVCQAMTARPEMDARMTRLLHQSG